MQRPYPLLCKSLLLSVFLATTVSAQNWIEIKSKNFTVITDGGDRRGREVALHFEQMREIFGTLFFKDKINATAPLSIIAFKDAKELSQVAPLYKGKPVEMAGVYYGGEDRHFIAVDLSSPGGWAVVFHEYAHMLLNTNYPHTRPWFDEGFAEYYSTIEITKKEVKIGLAPEYIGQQLAGGLMPLEKLLSITADSKEYNEGDRRSLFYAQSWLFVHYLHDTKRFEQLPEYFDLTINQNRPVAEAIKTAWGVEPKELDKDLHSYMGSNRGVYLTAPLPNVGEDVTYASRHMKDYEADAVIADLHLHSTDYFDKAGPELEAVLQKDPQNAAANSGLGNWYVRKDDWGKAEEYFQRAAKLGSTDARVYFMVAEAIYRRGDRDPQSLYQMTQALDRAIKYDAHYAEAYNLRGYVLSNMHDFLGAARAIETAIKINPRNEHFQMNLAQEYMAGARYDDAIELFERLKGSSDEGIASQAAAQAAMARDIKSKPMLQLSTQMQPASDAKEIAASADAAELKAMEARQRGDDVSTPEKGRGSEADSKPDNRPMKYLTGKLIGVDCAQEPRAVLKVLQGTKTYKFTTASVNRVLVIGANEFSCLWKDRKVSVNYRENSALQGEVVSVEVY